MKKKGEFKAARAIHIAKQSLYDAIKLAREAGESWVTLDGKRLRLNSPELMIDALFGEYNRALVMTRDGGIRLGDISEKDGLYFNPENWRGYVYDTSNRDGLRSAVPNGHHIQYGDIAALVIEEHVRIAK